MAALSQSRGPIGPIVIVNKPFTQNAPKCTILRGKVFKKILDKATVPSPDPTTDRVSIPYPLRGLRPLDEDDLLLGLLKALHTQQHE